MSGDVSLTSALRNNLLSLQSTQRSIDTTQQRLSTGKRVNSALDNPLNFFRAESFGKRADDLNTLLDGVALSIRTIEEADAGVTAVLAQLDSAKSLVDQAQTEINANGGSKTLASLNLKSATTSGIPSSGVAISALLGDIAGFGSGGGSIVFTLDAGDFNTAGGPYQVTIDSTDTISGLLAAFTNLGGGTIPYTRGGVTATYDDTTGTLQFTAADGLAIDSFSVEVIDADTSDIEDSSVTIDNTVITDGKDIRIFTGSRTTLQDITTRYGNTLNEINAIVGDASYQGINLLENDDLLTTFNEDGSSTLTTLGEDFSSTGLGLTGFTGASYFSTQSSVSSRANELADAVRDVRNFGASIANDLSIIQTRRDFTESTVNTLRAGSDDLTLADLNEEGANLLALQTRQQLGVTSLSLASQSQQAVLRLF